MVSKPVKVATVNVLFRNGLTGTAWFDDVCAAGAQCDRGPHLRPRPGRPAGGSAEARAGRGGVGHRRRAGADASMLKAGRRASPLMASPSSAVVPGASGCAMSPPTARGCDRAAPSQTAETGANIAGEETDAGLALSAPGRRMPTGLDAHVTVPDTTGRDRALPTYFVLPLADQPWKWHDDVLHSLPACRRRVRQRLWLADQRHRLGLPVVLDHQPQAGLSLPRRWTAPRSRGFTYNGDLKALYVAVRPRVSSRTPSISPHRRISASRSSRHDPAWGFRAATAKYYRAPPAVLRAAPEAGGIWIAFGRHPAR